jgi:hypothetical protein
MDIDLELPELLQVVLVVVELPPASQADSDDPSRFAGNPSQSVLLVLFSVAVVVVVMLTRTHFQLDSLPVAAFKLPEPEALALLPA